MRNVTRRRTFGLTLAGTAALAAPAVRAQTRTSLRFVLDWAFQGQQAPFTLALDRGYYTAENLDVVVDRGVGSGDSIAKIAAGAYHVCIADIYAMMRFTSQNPTAGLIAVMMWHEGSALACASHRESNIRAPRDLTGKKIAAPPGDASRQVFPIFAAKNNIGSVEWLNVSADLRETMLVRRQADAISGHMTTIMFNLRAQNQNLADYPIMRYSEHGVNLYGHGVLTTRAFAEANANALRGFLRATMKGLNDTVRDPAAAVASVKRRDALLNDAVERERLQVSLDVMMVTPAVRRDGMSQVDMNRLQTSLNEVAQAFEMREAPRADQIYATQYLPSREELRIAGTS